MLPVKLFSENAYSCLKNNLIYRNLIKKQNVRSLSLSPRSFEEKQSESSISNISNNKDPAPLFFDSKVQELMKRLTGLDMSKVFRTKPAKYKYDVPTYQFMTEKQLQKAIEDAKSRGEKLLQFFPILKEREPTDQVIAFDPELQGLEKCTIIFTDISYGISDKKRTIVARDPDGTLRGATCEERDRMNQIYFPVEHRKLPVPKFFYGDFLKAILDRYEYEYVLDRACIQFEPDSKDFIRVYQTTFDHIDSAKKYDLLYSTRHYGPMVFYYAFYTSIDKLLFHLFEKDRLDDAVDAVKLYHILKSDSSKSAKMVSNNSTPLSIVKDYVKLDAVDKSRLEMIIQTYEDLQKTQKQFDEDVKRAHGQS